jgi:hypothetical protein
MAFESQGFMRRGNITGGLVLVLVIFSFFEFKKP